MSAPGAAGDGDPTPGEAPAPGWLRGFLASAGIYTAGNVVAAAVPFLALPVLTRLLPPEDLGRVGVFETLVAVAVPLAGWNLHGALARYHVDREALDLPRFTGTCFLTTLAGGALLGLLLLALAGPLGAAIQLPPAWIPLAAVLGAGNSAILLVLALWQMQTRAAAYVGLNLARRVTDTACVLGVLAFVQADWRAMLLTSAAVTVATALVAVALLARRGEVRWAFDPGAARDAAAFGVPLIPHTVGFLVITLTDRLFIAHFIDLEAAGAYYAAFRVASILAVLHNAVNTAWVPRLYEALAEDAPGARRHIVRLLYGYFAILLALAAVLGFAIPPLLAALLGGEYAAAAPLVPWIAFGFALDGMNKGVVIFLWYAKRTGIVALTTVATALANVGLNWTLIPSRGALGAAQASLVSFALLLVLVWIASARLYPMPWLAALRGEPAAEGTSP